MLNKVQNGEPARVSLERALMSQIGILSFIVMILVAGASAFISLSVQKSSIRNDLSSRLDGYHQVMSYMVEDVDYAGAQRIANLIVLEPDLGDFRITNRFGRMVTGRGDPDNASPNWNVVEREIVSEDGITLATAKYLVRVPVIKRDRYFWIGVLSIGTGSLFAIFGYLIFRKVRASFVGPIEVLHGRVSSARQDGLVHDNAAKMPKEIADLSVAFDKAYHDLEVSAERNVKHVAVLTRLLSNFAVAIRYLDKQGDTWDYGHIPEDVLPAGEPALEQRSITASREIGRAHV